MNSNWDRVCYFCHKIFLNPFLLLGLMATHTKDTSFNCNICSKGFKSKQNFKCHSIFHISKNCRGQIQSEFKHTCKFCNKRFPFNFDLNRHILSHTKEKAYQCDICKKRFGDEVKLRRHKEQVHEKLRPFTCKQCEKSFATRHELKMHLIVNSKTRNFQCQTCLKIFSRLSGLNTHVKCVHLGQKRKATKNESWKLICYFCQKKNLDNWKLEDHMRKHTKEKPFCCSVCSRGFSYIYALKKHSNTHLSQEEKAKMKLGLKHLCKICQKRFQTPSILQRHITSHTKEKPFRCKICKTGLTTKASLNLHIKLVHKKIRLFKCKVCEKPFARKSDLQNHFVVHSNIFDFTCPQCPKKYKQKANLRRHFKVKHLSGTMSNND